MSQSVQLSRLLCRNLLAGRSWRGRLSAVSAAVKSVSGLRVGKVLRFYEICY